MQCTVTAAASRLPAARRRLIGRRQVTVVDEIVEEVVVDSEPTEAVDLLAVTPEVEAQLSVEEEIERRTAQEHNDTPHFRKDAE